MKYVEVVEMNQDDTIQSEFIRVVRDLVQAIGQLEYTVRGPDVTPIRDISKVFSALSSAIQTCRIATNWDKLIDSIQVAKLSFTRLKTYIIEQDPTHATILHSFEDQTTETIETMHTLETVSDRCQSMVDIFNSMGKLMHKVNVTVTGRLIDEDLMKIAVKLDNIKVYRQSMHMKAEWTAVNKLADLLDTIISRRETHAKLVNALQ